jgi:hypothetical protein
MAEMTEERAKLLAELELTVGSYCYNGSIQNWGPGGKFEGGGRDFRYPLTIVDALGNKQKVRYLANHQKPEELKTGYYAFGANQLQIVMALDGVLSHLEARFGFKI